MQVISCRRAISAAVILFTGTPLVQGAESANTIQVTATRTAQTADESQASVTVIDRKQIDSSPAQSVDELLRTVPGIDITRNGGYGKNTSVFMRGTESDHVLVLIDGVRAASATLGSFAWANFSLDNIERIEVVRGPRAALYGSDAIGGVIQIFTREAERTSLKITGGSHRTREASFTTAGGEEWRYSLEAGRSITDSIPTNQSLTENHGFTNSHAGLTLQGNLSEANRLDLRINHNEGKNELDPSTGDSRYTNQTVSSKLTHTSNPNWMQQFLLGYTLDRSESFSPTIPSTITTKRYSAGWQNDLDWSEGLTSVGVDFWQDNATKDDSGIIDESIDNKALFIQHQTNPTGFGELTASARFDDHSDAGTNETWSLGWSKKVGNLRYLASYGTAFKAPSINDLYWPNSTSTFLGTTYISEGNPDLEPEESDTLELGLRHQLTSASRYEVSIYQTNLDNLIDWQTIQTGANEFTTTPSNIENATIHGLELIAATRLANWELSGSFTLLSAKNDATAVQLDNRPREKIKLQALWNKNDKKLTMELLGAGARNDRDGSVELDGYHVFNLNYQWDYAKQATGRIRFENLFDEEYVLSSSFSGDYNTIGRSMFIDFIYYFDNRK
ncbi:TonB-dependent receptor domain-containing protein [Thiohalophilus sp.]|uniref:TonB-dependent receptor domain-containing protein n=1 Tax=Thiohalophilus sp. TaxID=3028392 RepID=UPI002ACD1FCF|nr:TonB-dependent receptor [Thiohalophilus sp.]MDZ7803018.1 TonB-dependent receptor [Thiohalophilus sp.]